MTCKEAEIEIVTHITETTKFPDNANRHISNCRSCINYQKEISILFNNNISDLSEPEKDYWNFIWQNIEASLKQEAFIIRLINKPIFRQAIASIFLIAFGFWLSQLIPQKQAKAKGFIYDKQVSSILHKTRMSVVAFTNMEEYEQHEILIHIVQTSNLLLKEVAILHDEYQSNSTIQDLLGDIERLLMLISSMENKSPSTIQKFQYRFQEEDVLNRLNKI